MKSEYSIYDMKDYEQFIYSGTMKEIAKFLNCKEATLHSYLSHKKAGRREGLVHRRYEIIKIEEDDIKEEIEEVPRKTHKEIMQELLNVFRPSKVEFEIFDDFEWELKGRMDKIIVNEEWKQIPGFEYSISNYGRIKNNKNKQLKRTRIDKWLVRVDIYKDKKRYTMNVCRMEANLFIRELKDNERVIHKDGDTRNNYYKNLEIVCK